MTDILATVALLNIRPLGFTICGENTEDPLANTWQLSVFLPQIYDPSSSICSKFMVTPVGESGRGSS
jgi:hypothetical protein